MEERNSLMYAREFLVKLLDPKQTPNVPRAIRQEALRRLHHYPAKHRIEDLYPDEKEKSKYKSTFSLKRKQE